MKVLVKTKPNAKATFAKKVKSLDGKEYFLVAVKESPKEGRANTAVEKALAEYFDVAVSRVKIVSGHASREKIIEIGGSSAG